MTIYAWVDCQTRKYKNVKRNKAAIIPLSTLSTFYTHCISMDSIDPINTASERNQYNYVSFDQFSIYIVTLPTQKQCSLRCKVHISTQDFKLDPL